MHTSPQDRVHILRMLCTSFNKSKFITQLLAVKNSAGESTLQLSYFCALKSSPALLEHLCRQGCQVSGLKAAPRDPSMPAVLWGSHPGPSCRLLLPGPAPQGGTQPCPATYAFYQEALCIMQHSVKEAHSGTGLCTDQAAGMVGL